MSILALAVREERWELAALLLLRALLDAAERIPEDAVPQLLEALEGAADGEGNG
ncbi:MAG: hypothetical protein HY680_02400 [Chloroflexi bacterium]|nr:hypothetical protein [Chloroflexota bacterium]